MSETLRSEPNINQTHTILMPTAVNLWEIHFLEACHFFVELHGSWGYYLIEVVELNSGDKHRSLAKINKHFFKEIHNSIC